MKKIRILLWVCIIAVTIGFVILNLPSQNNDTTAPSFTPIAGFNQGAHFTLTTHADTEFNTRTHFKKGDYGLIFFGFTHCPSICPTELQKIAAVMDNLPPETATKITPLFVTIDPDRDTQNALAAYVPMFHDRIIGLTGNAAELDHVLNAWKVYYAKVEDPNYSEYTMDHSTYSYLVDHNMNILALYRLQTSAAQITENIRKITN